MASEQDEEELSAVRAAQPAARRLPPRALKIIERAKKKRAYQQAYRDKRKGKGLPDNRRVAAALLAVVLELDAANRSDELCRIFEIVSNRLARTYDRDVVERLIKRLRDDAFDEYEKAEFRKKWPKEE
jgi:hypothetical protein